MIEVSHVTKRFDRILAVSDLSLKIREGEVFGLIGTNGAGKSTLLRLIAGVLRPDEGEVTLDEQQLFEHPTAKAKLCYLSDEGYTLPNASPQDMAAYYAIVYPAFDRDFFSQLLSQLGLDATRKISTFSKGMKRQLQIALGMAAKTRYLLCDETFDGLDPAMRQAIKSMFASEMISRPFTPVIASHNLRELEDLCEHVGLLHQGGVLLSRDLEEMKLNLQKIQCVIPDEGSRKHLLEDLDVVSQTRQGSLLIITARGSRHALMRRVQEAEPVFSEVIPLSLEEIFICETEVAGYDVKSLIL